MTEQNIIVWENARFEIRVPSEPHIDAQDGGHIVIYPKSRVTYTHQLSRDELQELILLEAACEKIMLEELGADHVNIQRNGNWYFLENPNPKKGTGPHLHVHIYGRSKGSERQPWGEALIFPNPTTGWLEKIQNYNSKQKLCIIKALKKLLN